MINEEQESFITNNSTQNSFSKSTTNFDCWKTILSKYVLDREIEYNKYKPFLQIVCSVAFI